MFRGEIVGHFSYDESIIHVENSLQPSYLNFRINLEDGDSQQYKHQLIFVVYHANAAYDVIDPQKSHISIIMHNFVLSSTSSVHFCLNNRILMETCKHKLCYTEDILKYFFCILECF